MPETVGPPPVRVVERRRSSCGNPRAADQYGELQPRADRHRAARWVAPHGRYPRAPRRARSSPACASRRTRVGVPVATRTRGSRPGDGRPRGGPRPDRPGARAGPHPQYRAEYPADAVVIGIGLPPRDEPAPVAGLVAGVGDRARAALVLERHVRPRPPIGTALRSARPPRSPVAAEERCTRSTVPGPSRVRAAGRPRSPHPTGPLVLRDRRAPIDGDPPGNDPCRRLLGPLWSSSHIPQCGQRLPNDGNPAFDDSLPASGHGTSATSWRRT